MKDGCDSILDYVKFQQERDFPDEFKGFYVDCNAVKSLRCIASLMHHTCYPNKKVIQDEHFRITELLRMMVVGTIEKMRLYSVDVVMVH